MKPRTLLFIDPTHPKPYDYASAATQAMGGTESSLLQTARILAQNHRVFISQHARNVAGSADENPRFIGAQDETNIGPVDAVVVLRQRALLPACRQTHPKARLLLWIHTYKKTEFFLCKRALLRAGATLVCNSHTHALHTDQRLNRHFLGRLVNAFTAPVPIAFCHNPVPQPRVDKVQKDPDKLVFFSSPNKGLDEVLAHFKVLRDALPEMRLYIANPGYRADAAIQDAGVINLGALPQKEIHRHVAEALCVFYPQRAFAETFGLIYAEANALGTPVLACDVGAAREILHPDNPPLIHCDSTHVIETIKAWRQQPPSLAPRDAFSDAAVCAQWHAAMQLD